MNNIFLKNIVRLATATTIAQVIVILSSPVLTRLYSPEEFGVLAIYTSLLNLVVVISSLRYELAIPLPKNESHARTLFSISFQSNLFFGLLILIIILFFNNTIIKWTNASELNSYLWLLTVGIVFYGTYKSLSYWTIRKKEFKKLSRTKVYQSLSSVIIQIFSGFIGIGALGLILGQIVGQSAGIATLLRNTGLGKVLFNIKSELARKILLIKEYKDFPYFDAPASLLNVFSIEMPQLLFASLFNPAIAGFYLLSQKVLGTPLRIIGQSLSQVLYGDIKSHIQKGTLVRITIKIIWILTVLTILPAIILLFYGTELFVFIFGQEWYEAGRFASVLIISISAQFIYSPISLILLATKGQKINFFLQLIMVILKLTAIIIGWKLNDPYLAVLGISIAGALVYTSGIILIKKRTIKFKNGSNY